MTTGIRKHITRAIGASCLTVALAGTTGVMSVGATPQTAKATSAAKNAMPNLLCKSPHNEDGSVVRHANGIPFVVEVSTPSAPASISNDVVAIEDRRLCTFVGVTETDLALVNAALTGGISDAPGTMGRTTGGG
ncbi:hypothetical protein ACFOZ0_20595 [Streptomyces yaanensis]|uniref:Uncharacterized protein n=1 Tax=Streptomyces yaanensis TaxID=1142239 RepID=A0ABV7SH76_9ACTN|nr:hypothetical protein [Streptomyces sp. CGMCC 4.7035]WNB97755.1 hypothetical protein Q2K21_06505 [Streptomyces sp. CGMCC 4.7035]